MHTFYLKCFFYVSDILIIFRFLAQRYNQHRKIRNNLKRYNKGKCQMSLEQKQEYLRNEIVEKGVDPEKFSEFWETFGIDFRNATMDDVVSIVSEYMKKGSQHQQNDDQFGDYVQAQNQHHHEHDDFYQGINWDFLATKHGSKTQIQKQTISSVSNNLIDNSNDNQKKQNIVSVAEKSDSQKQVVNVRKQRKEQQKQKQKQKESKKEDLLISIDEPNNINNVTFQQVLKQSESIKRKCLKLQPNILEHHTNVQIYISKFKQMSQENTGIINKLWKATYLLFTIKTIGRNKQKAIGISWEVQRQHSDFQWLRNTLIKMYPGLVVPPLPALVKSQDQLNGYQRKLQSFLLDCYNCPELRNSKYFEVFLSYSSQKDLQNFKKTCETTSKPKNLNHILNMQGQVSLLFGEKLDMYSEGLQSFLQKSSQHLKNVKNIIKQIDDGYSQISMKYKQLSQVFITMSEESCSFSDEECYPRLTQTYRQISQLVNQHSYFCMLEKQFLETFLHSHFAYERDRVDNMHVLITKRKLFTTEFAKPKHQTQKTTEQSGTSVFGKIGKLANLFGQKTESLDIPSSDTNILKDQVGYYNSQLLRQSIRCIDGMISSHVNHFSLYGHSRIDNVESMQKLWSKILVELSKLKAR